MQLINFTRTPVPWATKFAFSAAVQTSSVFETQKKNISSICFYLSLWGIHFGTACDRVVRMKRIFAVVICFLVCLNVCKCQSTAQLLTEDSSTNSTTRIMSTQASTSSTSSPAASTTDSTSFGIIETIKSLLRKCLQRKLKLLERIPEFMWFEKLNKNSSNVHATFKCETSYCNKNIGLE